MRAAADVARGFDTGHARHMHIEEADVRLKLLELIDGLAPVARLREYLQLRPQLPEQPFEHVAQQRLVVRDQCGRTMRLHFSSWRAGNSSSAQTPCGCTSVSRNCASPPNASCIRSRSVERPVPSPPVVDFNPTPVSVTRTWQRPSRNHTSTSMRPPSSRGSMP